MVLLIAGRLAIPDRDGQYCLLRYNDAVTSQSSSRQRVIIRMTVVVRESKAIPTVPSSG